MRKISPSSFTAVKAWDALTIECFRGVTTAKMHWTDQAYIWHINDGPEIFVVLDGKVNMHTRVGDAKRVHHLKPGDVFHIEAGEEHIAHPEGIARVLVIEQEGSV